MPVQARLNHDIDEGVRIAAVETTEARIMRVLDEEIFAEDATHIVRPMCFIASLFLSRVVTAQPKLKVPCPHDELRRAQTHPSLLVGGADHTMLYPLNEDIYNVFAKHMEMAGPGVGEYQVFTRGARGGWDVQEFGNR